MDTKQLLVTVANAPHDAEAIVSVTGLDGSSVAAVVNRCEVVDGRLVIYAGATTPAAPQTPAPTPAPKKTGKAKADSKSDNLDLA